MNKKHAKEGAAGWLDVDQIKERLPIRRVLEHYKLLDQLDVQGNTAVGLSPFHDSSMRSFRVELDRSLWNDFSGRPDGCAGHSVGLVQALENCSFRRALEVAAELAGIAEETRTATSELLGADETAPQAQHPRQEAPRRRRHASITHRGRPGRGETETRKDESGSDEPSARPAEPRSSRSPEDSDSPQPFGKELRGLLHDAPLLRELGISAKTAKAYSVGMAVRGLMKNLLACPVFVPGTDTVAAYVGRRPRSKPDQHPWKNPSGFRRSDHLFGLHRAHQTKAGQSAVERHGLLVVQSPLSVLRLAETGLLNAVALMDAEVSAAQIELLTRSDLNPSRKLTLLFNADERGQQGKRQAARRLIHHAYVRYAAWEVLDASHATSPKDLSEEALRRLVGV